MTQDLSDRIDLLGELVVEAETETEEFVVDLERIQIGYLVDDALKIRAGRFHNLLGYWNMAYHHGAQLQTTIERPQFLKFEDDGGVLPVHLIGLWVGGRAATPPATLEYGVMVGNGAKVKEIGGPGVLDPNSVSDNNKNKAVAFRLQVTPSAGPSNSNLPLHPLCLHSLRLTSRGTGGARPRQGDCRGGQKNFSCRYAHPRRSEGDLPGSQTHSRQSQAHAS